MINNYIKTFALLLFAFILSACNEGGVRVANNMEKYAVEYIEENNLLNDGENIVAFYDCTISTDASECAILTDKRVIYHKKDISNMSINLEDVEDIQHSKNDLEGDRIVIKAKGGEIMIVEIATLNDGDIFLDALYTQVDLAAAADSINPTTDSLIID